MKKKLKHAIKDFRFSSKLKTFSSSDTQPPTFSAHWRSKIINTSDIRVSDTRFKALQLKVLNFWQKSFPRQPILKLATDTKSNLTRAANITEHPRLATNFQQNTTLHF